MKLSIIIVNYNVKYFLEQALLSVFTAIGQLDEVYGAGAAEIWVVDNNSADGSVDMLRQRFPQVKLIANENNTGFSFANNQAIRQAAGEYVLLLNPDTVVQEETFVQTVAFMDSHPRAGGLGIKMLEGKGEFLPESKRGFPSPAVAFYKISGFSRFFPQSKTFGRYHLGFLSNEEIHEVDVLAGAFMLLRRQALEEVGLLDEDFFMYGEDIDLSYRIVKGGWKNYYFPHAPIIHYKGESTKKSSINYVFVFYRAMVIFARKHLPKNSARAFALLINIAIYLRAGIAMAMRVARRLALPALDFAVIYAGMYYLVRYWEYNIKYVEGGRYPPMLLEVFVPLYILFWIIGLFLNRGYQRPFLGRKIISGAFTGTVMISVIYAFLNDQYRFSRALIIIGGIIAAIGFTFNRLLLHFLSGKGFYFENNPPKRILIAGEEDEARRVSQLLDKTSVKFNITGFVAPGDQDIRSSDYIGHLSELARLIEVYKTEEVIFCARDISFAAIIGWMEQLSHLKVDFKIVPRGSVFVIGSNSKNEPGDYYIFDEQMAISRQDNKLNKRIFDAGSALLLLLSLPLNIWFVKNSGAYLRNIFRVLGGKYSWVGYNASSHDKALPAIKAGILQVADELPLHELDEATRQRLDYLYAKDYTVYKDIAIFLHAFGRLGRH